MTNGPTVVAATRCEKSFHHHLRVQFCLKRRVVNQSDESDGTENIFRTINAGLSQAAAPALLINA